MTELSAMLTRISKNLGHTFDAGADPAQLRISSYNKSRGKLEGYDCQECNNRGDFMGINEYGNEYIRECKCMEIRRSMNRMAKSGLSDLAKRYTFKNFQTDTDWQRGIKERAMSYAKSPVGWFFMGGQVGCGKTHLCTAVSAKLMRDGRSVIFMPWRDAIIPLKANVNDDEQYLKLINPLKKADVLYIDDFFKAPNGNPTAADINLAYELINYRYNNSNLITIISSERSINEIMKIDLAVGSRIYERTKNNAVTVGRDAEKNYRTRGAR